MPELPDIVNYVEALRDTTVGATVERVSVRHPFLLRTVTPAPDACAGRIVRSVHRAGKQIVFEIDGDLFIAIHLMIAGRLAWTGLHHQEKRSVSGQAAKGSLAEFEFSTGLLRLTEAGTKRRAALRILSGPEALAALDRGGIDVATAEPTAFAAAIRRNNHTLKRALTDPRIVSGIGNAYSDEILHAARLSPFLRTASMTDSQIEALHDAARSVLASWTDRLRSERAGGFPRKLTAFHPAMAVHGKYGKPCPVCGTIVQRIRYAENEADYCPRCQTGGTVYADRALSRLLKDDWPRTIEDLEQRQLDS